MDYVPTLEWVDERAVRVVTRPRFHDTVMFIERPYSVTSGKPLALVRVEGLSDEASIELMRELNR